MASASIGGPKYVVAAMPTDVMPTRMKPYVAPCRIQSELRHDATMAAIVERSITPARRERHRPRGQARM